MNNFRSSHPIDGRKEEFFDFKMIKKFLPVLVLLAIVILIAAGVYYHAHQQKEIIAQTVSFNSDELKNEIVMAKNFFVLEYIPEQDIVVTGLVKPGYGKVIVTDIDGTEALYSFDKNTNGLILPPPEEWQSLKVTGYW